MASVSLKKWYSFFFEFEFDPEVFEIKFEYIFFICKYLFDLKIDKL